MLQYKCASTLRPDTGETNKNRILAEIGPELPPFAPGGAFMFCFRRIPRPFASPSVSMVWFGSRAEGDLWLQQRRVHDYLSGTTEEFAEALQSRKEPAADPSRQQFGPASGFWVSHPRNPGAVLVSLLLLALAFFSWSYADFFGPDAVYYFARRITTGSDFVRALSGLDDRGHFRPMGMVLFSYVFFPLFRYNPVGHHLFPLFFHTANAILVYGLARRLLGHHVGALGATLFFALHRINFFVTHGITFTPDFTGVFFILAALLCYLKGAENRRYRAASLALWMGALLSKEVAIVFPAILFCYEFLCSPEESGWSRFRLGVRRTLWFWILAVAFAGLIATLPGDGLHPDAAGHPDAATGPLAALAPKIKYLWWGLNLAQGTGLTRLLGKNLGIEAAPIRQAFPHHTSLAALLLLPFMAAFVLFVLRALIRRDKTVVFGIAYFLFALIPVLPLTGQVMQHNLYFPLFGAALLFGLFALHIFHSRYSIMLCPLIVAFLFSTGTGVVNSRINSWPVVAARASADSLQQFRSAVDESLNCSTTAVLIAKTGQPDFLWYTDGGNLFRVFGPCPYLSVYFEDLGQRPATSTVIRVQLRLEPPS
ncbi:MAG: glycosyltransferase family 39 protein [Acidobacteria bacterium]|nr:glycosyltransferase family 39 protein [Acidobacteriota bacterium]